MLAQVCIYYYYTTPYPKYGLRTLANTLAGNKPPWTLPAKAAYGNFDRKRAVKYFGVPDFKVPPFFPPLTLLVSNQRSTLNSETS